MTILSIVASIAAGIFFWIQLVDYEDGVIEIYATQQDAFIQLVLDQINLQKDRSSEEIVTDILGTLDMSSNRYWTLSKEQAMIFVKDVSETNRYKGFTSETYYVSDSAKEFIDHLRVNRIVHRIVQIGEQDYIASGVKFAYNGAEYEICLLTNPDTILDNNVYMNARINLSILLGLILSVFLVMVMTMSIWMGVRHIESRRVEADNEKLRITIEKMGQERERQRMFDPKLSIFGEELVDLLFDKLVARKIVPVTLILFHYEDDFDYNVFLTETQLFLEENYLRFRLKDNQILLVGVKIEAGSSLEMLKQFSTSGCELRDIKVIRDTETLQSYLEKIR